MHVKTSKGNKIKHTIYSLLTAIFSVIFYLFILFFTGCASKDHVVTKFETIEVFIPIKCDLDMPSLSFSKNISSFDNDDEKQLKRINDKATIFLYIEELESTLRACRGEQL